MKREKEVKLEPAASLKDVVHRLRHRTLVLRHS